ncbi:cathepsin-like cysteine protease [Theileria orientalis]|uniref:Dipeptidyl peptidase 1 n=1 Tax=Theileria orientalis TaxID=68886 RepID=A0A976M8L5_THEOR|nr:cathepsin-like cysteine protease [Theileria orientalis]
MGKDVIGIWKIYETEVSSGFHNCGSSFPNKNSENLKIDNFKSYLDEIYGDLKEFTVELSDENNVQRSLLYPRNNWNYLSVKSVTSSEPIGNWTLVYDEGLMINIENKNYFGYFKYSNIKNNECKQITQGISEDEFGNIKCYVTDPTRIQIGWYSKKLNDNYQFGCFYAQKMYNLRDNYVQGSDTSNADKGSGTINGTTNTSDTLSNKNYIIDLTYKTSSTKSNVTNNYRNNFDVGVKSGTSEGGKYEHEITRIGSWNRKNYIEYNDLTPFRFLQLRKGVHYYPINSYMNDKANFNLVDRQNTSHDIYPCGDKIVERNYSKLPKNWTWGDPFNGMGEDIHLFSQGDCGSCYVHSSLYVISKRFQILFNKLYPNKKWPLKQFELSIDELLKSAYCQGCFGGFLMLVGKHVKELGVHSSTDQNEKYSIDKKWYVKDYGYVGGFYESTNEINMMNEIITNGPIAVAIYAPNELFYYHNGVFDVNYNHGMVCDLPNDNFNGWEYTNHAIVIVGWGEEVVDDKKVKFWICKNTWGINWGVGGYFKMKRGVNLLGIESQAVYFDPCMSKGVPLSLIQSYNKSSYL